jgi:redox-sensitive bicupin YhaK (pirin superfamily)
MQFGMLRVLNDDIVSGGMGFSTHPHRDMEIISIPLSGTLEHRDSMGNIAVIQENEVQLMSAGTGVKDSEFNKHPQDHVNFLQIWVLPQQLQTRPRYDQQHFKQTDRVNQWQTIVSPMGFGEMGCQINQAAWFSRGHLQAGTSLPYQLRAKGQGVYIFVISGEILVHSHVLKTRDALGIWEVSNVLIHATKDSDVLLMDVPM